MKLQENSPAGMYEIMSYQWLQKLRPEDLEKVKATIAAYERAMTPQPDPVPTTAMLQVVAVDTRSGDHEEPQP